MNALNRIKKIIKENRKIRLLVFFSTTLVITGIITGKVIASKTVAKIKQRTCMDSSTHPNFESWVGDAKKMEETYQIKIYYWNITNPDDVLYNAAMPELKEVGPYVYYFGSEKISYEFNQTKKTVKYKLRKLVKFNQYATSQQCQYCNPNNMLTVINFAYINTMQMFRGDKSFSSSMVPQYTKVVIEEANKITGNESVTYRKLGRFNERIFPEDFPLFPNNWVPGFSLWLHTMSLTSSSVLYNKTNKLNFTISEMKALYNVISDSLSLGVGAPTRDCQTDETSTLCINNTGFLGLMSLKNKIKEGSIDNTSSLNQLIESRLTVLFCPNVTQECFASYTEDVLLAVELYATEHLSKLSIYASLDSMNNGLFTTRKESELSLGYTFSIGPQNIEIPGFVGNDSDIEKSKQTKQFEEYWTCENTKGRIPFTLAAIANEDTVPSSAFPGADSNFLKIDGHFQIKYTGHANDLTLCKKIQELEDTKIVFDSAFKVHYKLKKTKKTELGNMNVYLYDVDFNSLYGVNNKSVFVKGIIDLSKTKSSGSPLLLSRPHFDGADSYLSKRFNMKPINDKHSMKYQIEPITGATVGIKTRTQLNTVILDKYVSSPREPKYNIAYKQPDSYAILDKPFPIMWIEYDVVPSDASLKSFETLNKVMKIGCGIIVIGPLIGITLLLIAIYITFKIFKRVDIVDVKENPTINGTH